MCEQQFQAQVMDELKMLELKDHAAEQVRQAYINGWMKGMEDAAEMLKQDTGEE
jgi:hypothetical protein